MANLPFFGYIGIAVLLSLLATVLLGYLALRGKAKISHHKTMAIITIILAAAHGGLALLAYL